MSATVDVFVVVETDVFLVINCQFPEFIPELYWKDIAFTTATADGLVLPVDIPTKAEYVLTAPDNTPNLNT